MKPLTVAIDGPAGSGKSSVSRSAAETLGFGILDTGAAYRALAWATHELGADLDDERAVLGVMSDWRYTATLQGAQRVWVDLHDDRGERDVTETIRTPEVTALVSRVSRHPVVRDRLNAMFRRFVAESELPGVVIEGRDITTVVAPDAPVRMILTASPEVRARRRAGDLPGMSQEQVLEDLVRRDMKDAQVVDFFNPAPGVELIDTTHLNFAESVDAVIEVVRSVQNEAASEERVR